jgi:hypothetical protein
LRNGPGSPVSDGNVAVEIPAVDEDEIGQSASRVVSAGNGTRGAYAMVQSEPDDFSRHVWVIATIPAPYTEFSVGTGLTLWHRIVTCEVALLSAAHASAYDAGSVIALREDRACLHSDRVSP